MNRTEMSEIPDREIREPVKESRSCQLVDPESDEVLEETMIRHGADYPLDACIAETTKDMDWEDAQDLRVNVEIKERTLTFE